VFHAECRRAARWCGTADRIEGTPPPLVYENNGLGAATASKSLSNKGL
jgi:hypothetical protein